MRYREIAQEVGSALALGIKSAMRTIAFDRAAVYSGLRDNEHSTWFRWLLLC